MSSSKDVESNIEATSKSQTAAAGEVVAPAAGPAPLRLRVQDLLFPFLYPTLLGKALILYFGLNYSDQPGEGYGIGLVISIVFTVTMIGRFLWKFRNYNDE